ncbi:MAG: hypothetical protein ACOC8E_08720 [Planctomycetota bacterium]
MTRPARATFLAVLIALVAALGVGCRSTGPPPAPGGVPLYPAEWEAEGAQFPLEGSTPGWRAPLEKKLAEPVSFDFVNEDLPDAVAFFGAVAGVSIVLEANARRPGGRITLRRENVPLRQALQDALAQVGHDFVLRDGAIYIATQNHLDADRRLPTVFYNADRWKPIKAKMNQPVTFDFDAKNAHAAFAELSEMVGVPIVVDQAHIEPRKVWTVTLAVEGMQLKRALAWMCRQLDLGYTVVDGTVFVSEKDHLLTTPSRLLRPDRARVPEPSRRLARARNGKVTFDLIATPLQDVVGFFRGLAGLDIKLGAAAKNRQDAPLTLRLNDVSFENRLDWTCRLNGLVYTVREDGPILITTPDDGALTRQEHTLSRNPGKGGDG